MANLDSPRGARRPESADQAPGPEATQPQTQPVAPPTGQPGAQPEPQAPPGYQPQAGTYPPTHPGNRPPASMGTTYSGVPPTVDTPAEPRRTGTDWVSRDRRDFDSTQVLDPDAQVHSGRHAVAPREHFIDTDERMAFGDEEYEAEPYQHYRARVSWAAVFGLVLGVVGALAALTGVLAPVGLLAGAAGVLFGLVGLATTRRPHIASRPLAVTCLLISIGALVLAWLAMYGDYGWLNRDNQASWLRDWLDARLPWLESW